MAASGHICINRAKRILLTAIVDQWHRHHIMFCRTALSLMDFEKSSIETKLWDSGREELLKTTTFLKRAGINT